MASSRAGSPVRTSGAASAALKASSPEAALPAGSPPPGAPAGAAAAAGATPDASAAVARRSRCSAPAPRLGPCRLPSAPAARGGSGHAPAGPGPSFGAGSGLDARACQGFQAHAYAAPRTHACCCARACASDGSVSRSALKGLPGGAREVGVAAGVAPRDGATLASQRSNEMACLRRRIRLSSGMLGRDMSMTTNLNMSFWRAAPYGTMLEPCAPHTACQRLGSLHACVALRAGARAGRRTVHSAAEAHRRAGRAARSAARPPRGTAAQGSATRAAAPAALRVRARQAWTPEKRLLQGCLEH